MDAIAKNLNAALLADKAELLRLIARDYELDAEELIGKYISTDKNAELYKKLYHNKKKRQEYVETEEYTFDGVTYLVDGRNQVYTYDLEKPMMVGEKLIDGSIKFFPAYNRHLTTLR